MLHSFTESAAELGWNERKTEQSMADVRARYKLAAQPEIRD